MRHHGRIARVAAVGGVVLVVLAPLGLFLLYAHGPRWPTETEWKCGRVAEGMTVEEVRGILGPEDGTVRTDTSPGQPAGRGDSFLFWDEPDGHVTVGFDRGGRVVSKHVFVYDL